jgi:nucleoside-diphosphate-sugar epimerase
LIVNASHPDISRSVFVTGATGFVGTHLCRVLTQHGWQVQAAIRAEGAGSNLPGIGSARLELFCEPMRWREAMRGCQGVVHLAARVHQMRADVRTESDYDRINVEGSRFVAEQALQAGVQRFVFLSSVKVNGEGADRPYRSGDAPDPRDAYGRSKWAAEQQLAELCANSRMGLAIIRPPLVYGPGVRANFHRLMRLASLGMPLPIASIANRRSFIGVTNLVDFIETCLTHPAFADTWLVSDGEAFSTPELLVRLSKLMGRPARMFGIPPVWLRRLARPLGLAGTVERLSGTLQVDSSAARLRLGWNPPVSVDEELARTVAAYLAERSR